MSAAALIEIIGCAAAWASPGEACSSYLVGTGDGTLLVDCGPGAAGVLLARMGGALPAAIVLTHAHFDHVADLVPLGYWLEYQRPGPRLRPRLVVPAAGAGELRALGRAATGSDATLDDWYAIEEHDGSPLEAAGAALSFRRMDHGGGAHAVRVDGARGSVCISGDTSPRSADALAELALEADVLLCEATLGEHPNEAEKHLTGRDAGRIALEARACRLVLTHASLADRSAAAAAAQRVFDGPVDEARPGLAIPGRAA